MPYNKSCKRPPGLEVIKPFFFFFFFFFSFFFSFLFCLFCSTQLSMKFSLLINMKMPTKVGIFIFISRKKFHAQLSLTRKNLQLYFSVISRTNFMHAQLS